MIRRALLVYAGTTGELAPDAARIRDLIREVLARHETLYAALVAHGVCGARACQLIDEAAMGDPS